MTHRWRTSINRHDRVRWIGDYMAESSKNWPASSVCWKQFQRFDYFKNISEELERERGCTRTAKQMSFCVVAYQSLKTKKPIWRNNEWQTSTKHKVVGQFLDQQFPNLHPEEPAKVLNNLKMMRLIFRIFNRWWRWIITGTTRRTTQPFKLDQHKKCERL